MDQTLLKARLIDLLQQENTAQQDFSKSLTDAERSEAGTPDRWSPKDLLAHIAAWQQRQTQRLAAANAGTELPALGPDDEINAADFEQYHPLPWQQVIEFANNAISALIAQVQSIPEDVLVKTPPNGRPVWAGVIGNGYSHPQAHLAEHYVRRGDLQQATKIQETVAEAISQFDKPYGRGVALYNLACFYSLNGQIGKALTLLPEALKLEPSLTDWSKEDTDLLPLHDEPAYKALYV